MRSERELYLRLKKKQFTEQIIKETLSFLKSEGFIDDKVFARAWIESRIKKPLGLLRIRQELEQKGIDRQIIDSQVQQLKQNYSEKEAISNIVRLMAGRSSATDPRIAKRRLYAYLLRRGFSPEEVTQTLN